jgi:hypothetical protein
VVPPVVQRPQLGTLVLRVPLAELVAEAEHPLLGPRLLLVAPGAAEQRVEAVLLHGVEQHRRLDAVARAVRQLPHEAGVDGLLHAGDHQVEPEGGHPAVAELEDLGEVVPGVDVHHRERDAGRGERLLGQPEHDDRVLAPREEKDRALELGHHLAHDEDALGLERIQM